TPAVAAEPSTAQPSRSSAVVARAGLVWTLVRTDFKARYHGSLGGFVWALLKPLSMFLVLMAVFSFLFASNPTYKLDLIIGLFLFLSYCVALVAVVVGFSLSTSVLFLRYRDLNQVWDVAVQAGFFVAPIIYPLGIIPERFHIYLYLWPPTPVIEFSRAVLVTGVVPTATAHLCLAID